MFNSKLHIYSRITIALVAAVVASNILTQQVFIGATPRVRTDLADRLVETSLALINKDTYIALIQRQPSNKQLSEFENSIALVPEIQIVRGVYAKESELGTSIEIKTEEVDWVEVPYTEKNGNQTIILIPRGTEPPPNGLF